MKLKSGETIVFETDAGVFAGRFMRISNDVLIMDSGARYDLTRIKNLVKPEKVYPLDLKDGDIIVVEEYGASRNYWQEGTFNGFMDEMKYNYLVDGERFSVFDTQVWKIC